MIDLSTHTDLAGHELLVTAAPSVTLSTSPGEPELLEHIGVEIGDRVICLDRAPGFIESFPHALRVVNPARHAPALNLIDAQCFADVTAPHHHPEPTITREMAAHVLYKFIGTGYRAGSFVTSLLDCIAQADPTNKALLSVGFPGYVRAVVLAQEHADGLERLQAIARGEDRVLDYLGGA